MADRESNGIVPGHSTASSASRQSTSSTDGSWPVVPQIDHGDGLVGWVEEVGPGTHEHLVVGGRSQRLSGQGHGCGPLLVTLWQHAPHEVPTTRQRVDARVDDGSDRRDVLGSGQSSDHGVPTLVALVDVLTPHEEVVPHLDPGSSRCVGQCVDE